MNRVAITAAGIASPIGRTFDVFAENLLSGRVGTRLLADRFGDGYADIPVRYGAVVDADDIRPPAGFREGRPVHRSILFAADALQQILEAAAAPALSSAALHCGVGVGQLSTELADIRRHGAERVLSQFERQLDSIESMPSLEISTALRADAGTEMLRQLFGLHGAPATYCGACSASTQACVAASEDVAAGATYAIGGGHDSLFAISGLHNMHELGTLTEEPLIRPFDVDRDGTMLGEGAAYFLFENLEHARARGATVIAEVVGWSSSIDGYHLTSPDPSGDAATRMIKRALSHAHLAPDSIDYVNAHGTATVLNDVVEAQVIDRALDGHRAFVSSTKAQVGHWIAACGAVGLAACLSALTRQRVPPNPNLEQPDAECDVNLAPRSAVEASLRHALCNSFGFGGQNSCVVLRGGAGGG